MEFSFLELELKGAYLINQFHVGDKRGGFTKSFEKDIYAKSGITFITNEVFSSYSMKNVIRGLHFQTNGPQAKLISVVSGSAWDVIVDLRPNSPTFMKWIAQELSADNCLAVYVPRGFAHGFASLDDGTVMLYQCDGRFDKKSDTGIRFDDPDLDINWPIKKTKAIISERDLLLPSFLDYSHSPMIV